MKRPRPLIGSFERLDNVAFFERREGRGERGGRGKPGTGEPQHSALGADAPTLCPGQCHKPPRRSNHARKLSLGIGLPGHRHDVGHAEVVGLAEGDHTNRVRLFAPPSAAQSGTAKTSASLAAHPRCLLMNDRVGRSAPLPANARLGASDPADRRRHPQ